MNTAHTLDTQLNVFETFDPKLSENSKNAKLLFLANILPMLQKQVREQMPERGIRRDGHDEFLDHVDEGSRHRNHQGRRLHHHQRRRGEAVDRRAEHSRCGRKDHGVSAESRRHQTRRIRRDAVYKERILCRAGVSA